MQSKREPQGDGPRFEIQRLFLKDLSYEAPNTPQTFVEDWKPEVELNLETRSNRLQEDTHEVVISLTATVKTGSKPAFITEVQYAGIFQIAGLPDDQLRQMLGSFCPNILFPYAREVISDVVVRGGFPQLILAPVNFDALYMQHMEGEKNKESTGDKSGGETKIH